MKCLPTEAKVEIDFYKPVHVIQRRPVPRDYWTYTLTVDVFLESGNTLEISGQGIKIRDH
jgi:hypothetical protein